MDYEKAYKDALERASRFELPEYKNVMASVFPELKESEDEKVRKELIDYINRLTVTPNNIDRYNSWIAWLEKQGEQKTADKVEAKFKVGDTMRTLQEANNGYTDGMPVVVSIDNEYYHCTNELIAIKDQDNYEFPPINVKQKPC